MAVETLLLSVVFGGLVGLLLGMMGGGGSILTVPVLVYVLGQGAHEATSTSLVIVGASAAIAALGHARAGRVDTRAGLIFGGLGGATALLGAWLNRKVSGQAVLFLFALLMVAAAVSMLRRRQPVGTTEQYRSRGSAVKIAGAGMVVGMMTGFFGVGGGFVIVPALVLVAGMPMHVAVGTSLLAISLQSAWGLAGHLGFGKIDWSVTAVFLLGSLAGVVVGGRISGRLSQRTLTRAFAVFLFLLAGYLVYRNYTAVFG